MRRLVVAVVVWIALTWPAGAEAQGWQRELLDAAKTTHTWQKPFPAAAIYFNVNLYVNGHRVHDRVIGENDAIFDGQGVLATLHFTAKRLTLRYRSTRPLVVRWRMLN